MPGTVENLIILRWVELQKLFLIRYEILVLTVKSVSSNTELETLS